MKKKAIFALSSERAESILQIPASFLIKLLNISTSKQNNRTMEQFINLTMNQ